MPAHVEIRVENERIIPIEFNPMRFAGWCTTDLIEFAFGFKTYDYFLRNQIPDWKTLLKGKENKLYTLIILNKPKGYESIQNFDYEALCKRFRKVLCLRKLDYNQFPVFGFLFTETESNCRQELDDMMKSDLSEFIG